MSDNTQRIDHLTNSHPSSNYQQVIDAHNRLNRQIQQMNSKISYTMDKNQAEFLVAYQNHIRKIKIQLSQIKSKSDAQEKQLSKNDRVGFLEKQVTLFREQAIKLYDRLQEKTQEAEIFRIRAKELEKSCFIAQKEVKQTLRQKKMIQAKLIQSQARITQLQQDLKQQRQTRQRRPTYSQQSNSKSLLVNNLNIRLKQQQQQLSLVTKNQTTASKTVPLGLGLGLGLGLRRKSINQTAGGSIGMSTFVSNKNDGELKDWFLQCVRTIKKDVAQRKNNGQQLNFQYIRDINQFKMVDKLRLLEKFMENQKLLIWMYQKIFPARMSQVRDYLSKTNNETVLLTSKKGSTTSQQNLSQPQLFQDLGLQKVELALPKMSESKHKKSEVRNKVIIRDGKLNVTML